MNETINNILNRRSTRVFTDENVNGDIVKEIVRAGLYAPSSKNKQLWHFTVIENKDVLKELNDDTKNAVIKYGEEYIKKADMLKHIMARANNDSYNIFYNAPVAILISRNTNDITSQDDCAVASENMMIAAESVGIGSCWASFIKFLFMLDKDKAKEYSDKFFIPDGYVPTHAIILGHKKNTQPKQLERREGTVTYIK